MTPEVRALIEDLLREGMTTTEAAKVAGVSDRRISEVRAKMEARAVDEEVDSESTVKEERERYEKGLRKAIPVSKRVKVLKTLLDSKNPVVSIKALELADRLSGYASGDQALERQTAPIFSLPAGTRLKVTK